MTVDEEALVAAIRADPDGDGPRIAYADWLGERGQVGKLPPNGFPRSNRFG